MPYHDRMPGDEQTGLVARLIVTMVCQAQRAGQSILIGGYAKSLIVIRNT